MLISIETHITCDFPGGSGPPTPPPLDPHLVCVDGREGGRWMEGWMDGRMNGMMDGCTDLTCFLFPVSSI